MRASGVRSISSFTRSATGRGGLLQGIAILALCLAVYLPGLWSIPVVDRDEARFAQASRQMLESVALPEPARDPTLHGGGLVVPRVAGVDRLKKPPLIYWLQAASAWALTAGDPMRDAIWMYRVPSVVAAVLTVVATWRLARRMMPPSSAMLAGALLGVCPLFVWDAHQARADQVLVAATTIAMGALWLVWSRRREPSRAWAAPLVFWVALGAGVMTKGPITPMVAGLAALAVSVVARQWRWLARLRPVTGAAIVGAMAVPWVIAVADQVGWKHYLDLVVYETVGRSTTPHEGHWGPPGYHAVLSAALFWPGSLLTLGAVVAAWRSALALPPGPVRDLRSRWHARAPTDDGALFLIAWLVPSWIVFELFSTKLPHYPMPLYPALALLTALAFDRALRGRARPTTARAGIVLWAAIGLVLASGGPTLFAALLDDAHRGPRPLLYLPAVLGASLVIAGAFAAARGRTAAAHALAIGAAVAAMGAVLGLLIPRNASLWNSTEIARHLDPAAPVASVGYHEDSLVFLTRGRLERISPDGARDWLDRHPTGALVVPRDLAPTIAGARQTAVVSGFNYSTGDPVDLRILRRDD